MAEASELTSHGLAALHAHCAAFEWAQVWEAEVAAELASHALAHALRVAIHTWLAEFDAWGVANHLAAWLVGAALEALAALDALHVAALSAAGQGAWVGCAALLAAWELEAWAFPAALAGGAWAVSEMALQAWAPGEAA